MAQTLGRDKRPDRLHECIGNRSNPFRLADSALALLEPLDGFQAPMHLRWDHRFLNAPTEQPNEASGPLVHFVATKAGVHDCLANRLELESPKVSDGEGPEQFAERPDREPDIADPSRRFAVLPVVTLREFEIGQRQLIHGEILWPSCTTVSRGTGGPPAIGQPLRDGAVIVGQPLGSAESTAVHVSAVQPDNALPRPLVMGESRHI